VTIYSDHNPLTFLAQASSQSSKLMRWALALQGYDVVFKYREGSRGLSISGWAASSPASRVDPDCTPTVFLPCFTIIACALASCFVVSILLSVKRPHATLLDRKMSSSSTPSIFLGGDGCHTHSSTTLRATIGL